MNALFSKITHKISQAVVVALLASLFVVSPFSAMVPKASALVATLADTDALVFNRANGVTNIVGTGVAANDIVLYKKVGTFGGIEIDCAITTVAVSGSISNYDNPGSASTATGYLNNFQINTVGGFATFKFEFFQAGTYTGPNTGIPVVLQNVKITSIDIDSSGTNGYQYTDFTGFQKYSLMNPTNLGVSPMSNPNRVRFIATKTGARSSVPEDQVLIKYDAIQSVQMTFGNVVAGSTNYFGLVFGGWPGTGTPVEYSNVYNTPPTSTSETLYVTNGAATTIPLASFGTYADIDNNPFYQIRIASLPASGSLQYLNGSNWVSVSSGQVISVADLQLGKLRFTGTSATSFTFSVHDGLDYSASTYTLTLSIAAASQTITFNNPGVKAPSNTPFASNATASSGLPVTLTSETTGVCTVSGLDITPVATGTCVITATQIGNASYSAAPPVTQTFPIDSKSAQTITFTKPADRTFSSTPFASSATASSGLTVTLTSYTPSVCTVDPVDPLKIKMLSTGTCQIQASQAGNSTYAPASPVIQTFVITPGAPAVVTTAATSVGNAVGTLNGTVNTFGLPTTSLIFCLSTAATTNGSGALTCDVQSITKTNETSTVALAVSYSKSGLTNGTTYYYQIVATTSGGTSYGSPVSFTPAAPSTVTAVTTQIYPGSSSSSSSLTGIVNAGGVSRNISFCWNKSTPSVTIPAAGVVHVNGVLGNCLTTGTPSPSSSSSSSDTNVTASISNLSSDTNYYYQIRIVDGSSYVYGKILMFRTSSPKAVTGAATALSTSATLNGQAHSGSSSSSASTKFCYNSTNSVSSIGILDQSLTKETTCVTATPSSVKSSSTLSNLTAAITGLTPGTTYYYQAIATRTSSRFSYGEIKSFTTSAIAPTVQTTAATGIAGTKANLNGFVTANTTSADNSFCWGTASNLSGCATVVATPVTSSGNSAVSITAPIEGLTSGTTYYFRASSTSTAGTTNGSILSFIAGSPLAITGAPSAVAATSAIINGAIKSNGLDTTATFCFGTSSSTNSTGSLTTCSVVTPTPATVAASTTSPTAIQATKTGLTSGTTYYYQAVATAGTRINYGAVFSFKAASEPSVTTDTVTSLAINTATLNGTILANGDTAAGTFCYSTSNSQKENPGVLDTCIGGRVSATNTSGNSWSFDATALKPGTRYYYQAIGENGIGTKYGSILEFKTLPGAPLAETHAPVVSGTSAVLNGIVESLGANTTVTFCHGTASNLSGCTTVTASPSTVSETETATIDVNYSLSGLTAGTHYYYRVIATNSAGTTNGAIVDFYAGAPTAETAKATSVTATSATLNGTVKSNGSNISSIKYCYFSAPDTPALEISGGMSLCYGGSATVTPVDASVTTLSGSDTSTVSAPLNVTGLNGGETYYFQIVAVNARGTSYGEVFSFYAGIPVVQTTTPSSLTLSTATLNGVVNPNGDSGASASICLSTTDEVAGDSLANCAQNVVVATGLSGSADTVISTVATGLTPATTYYYQASATGTLGQPVGTILSFTTPSAVVTFNKNDGSGTTATQTSPTKFPLTAQSSLSGFTRTGYTFSGWNTVANGIGGTAYADGADYAFDADITLYAQWTSVSAPTYSVTYDGNGNDGGSVPTGAASYTANASVTVLGNTNNLSKTNFTFDGWYTTSSGTGGTAYVPPTSFNMPSQNVVLYAKWVAAGSAPTPPTPTPSPVIFQTIKPAIVWKNPLPIRYKTLLSGIQLNAIATLPTAVTAAILDPKTPDQLPATAPRLVGTYTYLPMSGQMLSVGVQKLYVTFTPLESGTYEVVSATVEILVRDVPTLTWATPAPIKKGTPLSSTQLNAVGSVPGTYKYLTPAGTILAPGKQKLKVLFTPTDPLFEPIEGEVEIEVEPIIINPQATPIVTPSNTKGSEPVVNTTPAVILSVVTVGKGLTGATTNGSSVTVDPILGFSGKTEVLVKVLDQGEEKQITVPVTVLPLAAVNPQAKPNDKGSSTIAWTASPNAISYEVRLAGKSICDTSSLSCTTNSLIGPSSDIKVLAKGNDNTVAPLAPAVYLAPSKPITALVVYFDTNKYNLDAKDKADLRAIAKTIIEQGFKNVVVNGHTDVRGGVDNKVLSNNRAIATYEYLKQFATGLNVKLGAFASTKPAAKGNSATALAANRRAEVGVY